ncbi:hypothetical protein Cni_G27491 [Canna indica]|uniref:Uncharacterized protein n=1 Tax=Canna indica TaxID=4628 RepID=A0AAQ3L185_9LILI|nr:hypothetical protein Cni_G27491 [Canna indica]
MGTGSAMEGGGEAAGGGCRTRVKGFSEHRRHGRCSSNPPAQALIYFGSQISRTDPIACRG